MSRRRRWQLQAGAACGALLALFGLATLVSYQAPPDSLLVMADAHTRVQYLDRHGEPLSRTYQNRWNIHDQLPLQQIPLPLQQAFIIAEDQRFYRHNGVDWLARFNALRQNLQAGEVVRGASSISEQVVQMLHPRRRTPWSKWIEGLEAAALERRFTKDEILGFYLNQVPFARNRRGVRQAARLYFNRDLQTLDQKEMLTLAVLVRAPSRLDPLRSAEPLQVPLQKLATTMAATGMLEPGQLARIRSEPVSVAVADLEVEAPHFIQHLANDATVLPDLNGRVHTTLDGPLQENVSAILAQQLQLLASRNVTDGAVLVLDHRSNEVIAWANAGQLNRRGNQFDAIITARQPGSTLKPFLYALAMTRGWHAATIIEDAPLARAVGQGLHSYRNYSNTFYGKVRLRDALGNSLNTPAIRAVEFTGKQTFLDFLHQLGFRSLDEQAGWYGDGLALGNGEVTLLELVSAYATLARGGIYQTPIFDTHAPPAQGTRIVSEEVASLIGNILSDRDARGLEFGHGSILNTPIPIAAKTGTSNDFTDAWAVGFSRHYTVGVWMGNMDRSPMIEVSGSVGPGYILHSVFAELNRGDEQSALLLSRRLQGKRICRVTGLLAQTDCPSMNEWFVPEQLPTENCPLHGKEQTTTARLVASSETEAPRLLQPTPNLQLAMDPRIPDHLEVFPFKLQSSHAPHRVEWIVDNEVMKLEAKGDGEYLWPLSSGRHSVKARYWQDEKSAARETAEVSFLVK